MIKYCVFMSIVALTTSIFGDVDKAIYGSDGDGPYDYYKSHFYVDGSLCITIGNRIGVKAISNDFHGRPAYSNYYNEVCFADFKCWNWSHGTDFPNLPSQYSPWDSEFLTYTVTDFHHDKEKDNGVTNIVSQFLGWKGADGAYVYPFDRVSASFDTFTADFYDRAYAPNGGGVSRLPDNVAASSSCDKIVYVGDRPTITAVVNVGFLVSRKGDGYVATPESKSISAAIWVRQVQGGLVDSCVDKPYYIRKSLGSKTVNSSELDLSGFYISNHVPVTFAYELPDDLPPGSYEYYIEFNQGRREREESYYNNHLSGSFQVRYKSFRLLLEPVDADHANNRLRLRWYIDDSTLSKAASADYLITTCGYNFKIWHSGDYDERYDDFTRASMVDYAYYDTMVVDRYFGHKNYGVYPCRYWLSCYDPKTAGNEEKNNPVTYVDTRHRFGFVVGVSAYDDTIQSPPVPLESCREDAKKFADYLKNTPRVGDVIELYDANATMEAVSRELRNLPATCGLMPGDILFLWMSGHGILKYGGVVLYDGRYVTTTNTMPPTIVEKYAQTFQDDIAWTKDNAGVEVVGLLPICHAEQFRYDYAAHSNIVWICASKTNEEAVSYDKTSQFTQCFLTKGLLEHNACRGNLDGKPLKESILPQYTISSDIKYKHLSLLKLTRYAQNLAFGDSRNAPAHVDYYGYNAYTVLDSIDMDEWQDATDTSHVVAGLTAETNAKNGIITLTLHMGRDASVGFLESLLWFKRKTLINNPNPDTWHWLRMGALSPGSFEDDPNWPEERVRKISFGTGSALEKKHCGTIYSNETYDFAFQFVDENGFGACAYATGRTGLLGSGSGNDSDDGSGNSGDNEGSGSGSDSSDDSGESGETTKDIQYGPYVPGETVSEVFPDGASWKVTGLPTGLKWDAKLPGVTGTPTKPGTNTVYFTWTEKVSTTSNVNHKVSSMFIVGPLPVMTVVAVGETNGCKVTGGGAYLANKSITLKATAATAKKATAKTPAQVATVFAGWYEGDPREDDGGRGATALPASLSPSYTLTMPAKDVTLYAKFIAQTDDVAAVSMVLPEEMTSGETIENAAVDVSGCSSQPTVKVTGLPTGLKFTTKLIMTKKTTGSGKDKVTTLVTNALPNTIYGTPTKSGVYTVIATVTTAGKKTAICPQTVVVRKAGENVVKADAVLIDAIGTIASTEAVPGKVTGMGVYAVGKKVTLKVTANKGYVFAGWYPVDAIVSIESEGGKKIRTDAFGTNASTCFSRSASYTIDKMPANDVELVAAFITSECDKANIAATVNGMALEPWISKTETHAFETNIWTGVYLEWPVAASALSETTVKVAGLPSGLKFTAKPVTTKMTTGSGKTKVTTVVTNVAANTIYGAPSAASKTKKVKVEGEGEQWMSVPSQVKVTVTTAGKSSQTYQINTTVDPLPCWAVGTYAGPSYSDAIETIASTNGTLSVTIGANGKISAKQPVNGKSTSFAASYFDSYAADESAFYATLTAKVGKETVTNQMVVVGEEMTVGDGTPTLPDTVVTNGYVEADCFDAWQYNWKSDPWKKLVKQLDKTTFMYVVLSDGMIVDENDSGEGLAALPGDVTGADGVRALPVDGSNVVGKVTLKFAVSGSVAVAGEFVAGYDTKKSKYTTVKATGSTIIVPGKNDQGLVFVYLTPKGISAHVRCVKIPWSEE